MRINRRSVADLLTGAGLLFVSGAAFAQAKTVKVAMKQGAKSRFDPDTVTIAAGDTVEWTNTGFVTHSVTFDPSMAAKAADVALPAGVSPFKFRQHRRGRNFQPYFHSKGNLQIYLQISRSDGNGRNSHRRMM